MHLLQGGDLKACHADPSSLLRHDHSKSVVPLKEDLTGSPSWAT